MKKYDNTIENNEIVFKNLLDGSELKIKHYEDEFIFDEIFINEKYDLNFVNYIVQQLKKTKDIGVLFAEYDLPTLEKILYKNGLKVSNYQYTIKKTKNFKLNNYEVSNILNIEDKKFYLEIINKISYDNFLYLNPNMKYQKIGENWFKVEDFEYRVYRKTGKIVGIVEYKNYNYNSNYSKVSKNYFDYNNKLCIRCLLSEEEQVLEDILKDLLNIYKKDIIINITYNEKTLKNIVNKFDSKFNFCQYVFVGKDNNN